MDAEEALDRADGYEVELAEALGLLGRVARGETTANRVAWWLAANYRLLVEGDEHIMSAAESHRQPPRG